MQLQYRQGRAQQETWCHAGPVEGEVTTALGTVIPASLYTLPRLWDQLKQDAQYDKRLAQVKAFNRDSVWLKRGISMTPCRYCHHMISTSSQDVPVLPTPFPKTDSLGIPSMLRCVCRRPCGSCHMMAVSLLRNRGWLFLKSAWPRAPDAA